MFREHFSKDFFKHVMWPFQVFPFIKDSQARGGGLTKFSMIVKKGQISCVIILSLGEVWTRYDIMLVVWFFSSKGSDTIFTHCNLGVLRFFLDDLSSILQKNYKKWFTKDLSLLINLFHEGLGSYNFSLFQ